MATLQSSTSTHQRSCPVLPKQITWQWQQFADILFSVLMSRNRGISKADSLSFVLLGFTHPVAYFGTTLFL
jgi:hypothetical protein